MDYSGHLALRPSGASLRLFKIAPGDFVEPNFHFGGSHPPQSRWPDFQNWWREVDSNHRRHEPADLQSAPVGRLGIPPKFLIYLRLLLLLPGRWIYSPPSDRRAVRSRSLQRSCRTKSKVAVINALQPVQLAASVSVCTEPVIFLSGGPRCQGGMESANRRQPGCGRCASSR